MEQIDETSHFKTPFYVRGAAGPVVFLGPWKTVKRNFGSGLREGGR